MPSKGIANTVQCFSTSSGHLTISWKVSEMDGEVISNILTRSGEGVIPVDDRSMVLI